MGNVAICSVGKFNLFSLVFRSDIDAVVDELMRTEKLITASKVDQVG